MSKAQTIKPKWPFRGLVPLLILLLAAFGLYLFQLDAQSLWRDEALSVLRARQPLAQILRNENVVNGVSLPDLHPPLYFLLLAGWEELAGESEFAYRLPSVFLMLLTLATLSALAKRLVQPEFSRSAGLFVLLVAALSPFYAWYAQEARMYALLAWLGSLFLWLLAGLLLEAEFRWRTLLATAVCALALIYTHYTGILLVAFGLGALLSTRLNRQLVVWLLGLGSATVLLGLPLLSNLQITLTQQFLHFTARDPWSLLLEGGSTFLAGSTIPPSLPLWQLLFYASLAGLGLFAALRPARRRFERALLLGGGLLIPLLGFYLSGLIQPNYSNPRHLMILSLPLLVMVGLGIYQLWHWLRPLGLLAGAGMLALGGMALLQVRLAPPMVRDDVRGLRTYLADRIQTPERAGILWHDATVGVTWDLYALPEVRYTSLPSFYYDPQQDAAFQAQLEEWLAPLDRVWLVTGSEAETVVTRWLAANWTVQDKALFRGSWGDLFVTLYQRPFTPPLPSSNFVPLNQTRSQLTLLGIDHPPQLTAGAGGWFTLYWRPQTSDFSGEACLRLTLEAATLSESCRELTVQGNPDGTGGIQPTAYYLTIPSGLLVPEDANLQLGLRLGDETQALTSLSFAPQQLPTSQALMMTDGLGLMGGELNRESQNPGNFLTGHLLWQANASTSGTAEVRLVSWFGDEISRQEVALDIGEWTQRVDVVLPLPEIADGLYRAQVRLLPESGRPSRWFTFDSVRIEPWPYIAALPSQVEPLTETVLLQESIQLLAATVESTASQLNVTLYWQADETPVIDYGVFVHVGQPGREPLLQNSAEPVSWTRSTTGWRPGEIIIDRHSLPLPPDVDIADQAILVGMFALEGGDRPSLTVNGRLETAGSYTLPSQGETP